MVAEFATETGQTGSAADPEWAQIVGCLMEVYSPFNVTLTDQLAQIPAGSTYTETIIAGQPTDIGLSPNILALGPIARDRSPRSNVVSFSFANHDSCQDRVQDICVIAARELAEAFGLEGDEDTFVPPSPYPTTQGSACIE